MQSEFRQQAQVMHDSGANGIIVAYAWERIEMSLAIEAAQSVANWPIFATPVFANSNWQGGRDYQAHQVTPETKDAAVSIDTMVQETVEAGADVVGAHCGVLDLPDYEAIAKCLLASTPRLPSMPVMIKPNGSKRASPLDRDAGLARADALAASPPLVAAAEQPQEISSDGRDNGHMEEAVRGKDSGASDDLNRKPAYSPILQFTDFMLHSPRFFP